MSTRTFCVMAILAVLIRLSTPAAAAPPGDPVAGQTLWTQVCAICHGPVPSNPPPPLPNMSRASYSPSVISDQIANGLTMSTAPGLQSLSATDLANVAAYIGVVTNQTVDYQGLWWAAPAGSESGWGINLAHQYNTIFLTWFTYDTTGKAWWLVMTAVPGLVGGNAIGYTGTLYATSGPAFNAQPFDPNKVKATQVGMGTLTFTDANNGTFSYTVNNVSQVKTITREVFGTQPTCLFWAAPDYSQTNNFQDLWWAAPAGSESGWGINLTQQLAQQGDTIFATWFTYNLDGSPLWLVVSATKTGPNTYSGTLYQTSGPAFSAVPFDPGKVTATAVGSATFTFSDGNNATFAYTVNGINQVKQITRESFKDPGTLCQY